MAQAFIAHQSPDSLSWFSLMLQCLMLSSQNAGVLASIVLGLAFANVEDVIQTLLQPLVVVASQPLANFAAAPQRPLFDCSQHRRPVTLSHANGR